MRWSRRPPDLALLALLALAWLGCTREPGTQSETAMQLHPAAFADLPGWTEDRHDEALLAFRRSCAVLLQGDPAAPMIAGSIGKAADWKPACSGLPRAESPPALARAFFESFFRPFAIDGGRDVIFTGYYEPRLDGSRMQSGSFRYPLYRRPPDLVSVDLGTFDEQLGDRRIAGRVVDGRLVPYPDRAAITAGALAGFGLELFWVKDPVALFFLHIQGSGQIALPDHSVVRVGYADQNGRPYHAIGRDLVAMGALAPEGVSLQTIRAWLEDHADQADAVMAKNPSFVFFSDRGPVDPTVGPVGAMGVPLTPGRSVAVDRRLIGLGAPLWLETTAPSPQGERPLRRLVVAQDTGGAIRGALRGDVFWGAGALAEYVAGHMKSPGRWFILLPTALAPVS